MAATPISGTACKACIARKCATLRSPTSRDQPMIGTTAPVTGVPMKWPGKAASVPAAGRVSTKVRISPKASDRRSASGRWLSRAVQKDRPIIRLPRISTVATPPIDR